jgi:DNA modification methylase
MAPTLPLRTGERWRIEHADCLDVLRTLPDGVADAFVTDPPYGISYESKKLGGIRNDDRPFIWWLRDAWRITRDGGALVCFCRWDVQEAFKFAIELAGFRIRSQVVWDREVHGMGDTAGAFAPRHDVVWFATKGRFRFPRGRPPSVLRAKTLRGAALTHPTEKPVPLLQQLVRAVTPPGGLVIDPFTGSGSTGHAVLLEGGRFFGTELDEVFVANARARLTRVSNEVSQAARTG